MLTRPSAEGELLAAEEELAASLARLRATCEATSLLVRGRRILVVAVSGPVAGPRSLDYQRQSCRGRRGELTGGGATAC